MLLQVCVSVCAMILLKGYKKIRYSTVMDHILLRDNVNGGLDVESCRVAGLENTRSLTR